VLFALTVGGFGIGFENGLVGKYGTTPAGGS
jgi:hypothetical protein